MSLYHANHRLLHQHCRRRRMRYRMVFIPLILLLPFLLLRYCSRCPSDRLDKGSAVSDSQKSRPVQGALPVNQPLSHEFVQVDGRIRNGESIYQCLRREGISERNIQLITENLQHLLRFRSQIRPGDTYRLSLTRKGEVERFEYEKSPLEIYCLSKDRDDTWNVSRERVKLIKYWVHLSGQVHESLFTSFQEAGFPVSLALQFAEILEWKVDFQHEVRDGDRFDLVFERFFQEDQPIGFGRILAVSYEGEVAGSVRAFYCDSSDGRGDYYSSGGISLRQAFLRAPLSYKYISSGFNYHRMHPILGYVRPHLGIDFAAPHGSPVWAVADGTVYSKSYDRANGNQIIVRHMNGYVTYYNHLSRFARGIRKGERVTQKQIIGYVGTTGLSTGPHLDYRVKKDGRFINSVQAQYPSGKPIEKAYIAQFKEVIASLDPLLRSDEPFSRVLVAEVDSSEVPNRTLLSEANPS